MGKSMPKNIIEERLRWIQPILDKKVTVRQMAEVSPFGERTLKRWIGRYKTGGAAALEPASRRPKSNPKETPIRVKERVLELRQEESLCALKLKWELADEGVQLHERTIGKILKNAGITRQYRSRKGVPIRPGRSWRPGEMIEIDVKYVPVSVQGLQYFQYTAIDCGTKWRHLEQYDCQSNSSIVDFLYTVLERFPWTVTAIKTDNHPTFTNRYLGYPKSSDRAAARLHPLDEECAKLGITHYLIDPGKPSQNGTVERSHGADEQRLYEEKKATFGSLEELRYQTRLWNMRYNNLRHISLNGRTPQEALTQWVPYVRT